MPQVEKSMLLGYSSQDMFMLVEDIESYPLFLPWCKKTHILFRDEHKTIATLHIEHLGVKVHFTTENEKNFPCKMSLKLVDGPFTKLEGAWNFKTLTEKACKIDFHMLYEFSNRLLNKPLSAVFGVIADKIVDAFVERAKEVYGKPDLIQ